MLSRPSASRAVSFVRARTRSGSARVLGKETLEIRYKHKNIYQVLEMTIEEAYIFFQDIPAIADRLKTLNEVGLGYLKLGQSATTLSGGEAQRVKIASELYRRHTERTIYLLDEQYVTEPSRT